jgi:CheY-specific phosphatase CheX
VIESSIGQTLAESVREVLEKMFFVDLLEPAGNEGPRPNGIAAQLTFDGDPPGSFRLDLDWPAATAAAADFLGEDPAGLSQSQIEEVACELANMICGSVLSRLEGTATFRLSKPEIAREPAPAPPATLVSHFRTSVGDGALRAEIRLERPVCPEVGKYGY